MQHQYTKISCTYRQQCEHPEKNKFKNMIYNNKNIKYLGINPTKDM